MPGLSVADATLNDQLFWLSQFATHLYFTAY